MGPDNFIQWRTELSLGIKIVDDQHQELISLLNRLLEICRGNNAGNYEAFNALLSVMTERFLEHFETEERLMREKHYPGYDRHKKRHDKLMEDIEKMIKKIRNEGQKITLTNTVIFLREWLLESIYGADKEMGEYFIKLDKEENREQQKAEMQQYSETI